MTSKIMCTCRSVAGKATFSSHCPEEDDSQNTTQLSEFISKFLPIIQFQPELILGEIK